MQSKTSSFNRGMWIQSMRNVGWIGLVYLLVLLFALPLQLIFTFTGKVEPYIEKPDTLFDVFGGLEFVLMFVVPVLLGIFLFRYIQTKIAADYIHSLPIKRSTLFHQNMLLGALVLVVPILITGIVIFAVKGVLTVENVYTTGDVLSWVGYSILINLFVLTGTVLAGMFTGMSVLQGIFLYVLFLLPGGISYLAISNVKFYWYGYAYDYYVNKNVDSLIPFLHVAKLAAHKSFSTSVFVYIGLIVLFYIVALITYQKRRVEAATLTISVGWLKPVFVYGVTACSLMLGGFYFISMKGEFSWMVVGYIIGSLIGYTVAQIILNKTWRIFTKWKGYLGFVIAAAIVGFIIHLDVFGYSTKVPAVSEIESVYFDEDIYRLTDKPENYAKGMNGYYEAPYYYTSKETIKSVRQLQKQITASKDKKMDPEKQSEIEGSNGKIAVFAYKLKNGKQIVREYFIPFSDYKAFYKEIAETKEYKENFHPLLRTQNTDKIKSVSFSVPGKSNSINITNPEKVQELIHVVKQSMMNETFDEMYSTKESWASINFMDGKGQYVQEASWEKSYSEVEAWLKKEHLYERARLMPKDVEKTEVFKNSSHLKNDYRLQEDFTSLTKDEKSIKVKNNQQVETLLQRANLRDTGDYLVAFYYKDQVDTPQVYMLNENELPNELKEKLK